MSLYLLVVGDRARVNPLVSLLECNGVKAVPFVARKTVHILEGFRLRSDKDILVVFGDALEDAPGFFRLFQRVQQSIKLVMVVGENQNSPTLYDVRQLIQKIEASASCKTFYFSYKAENRPVPTQKSIIEEIKIEPVPTAKPDGKKAGWHFINGRTIYLEARSGEIFDIIVKAEGKVVPWRELRQYFENRGTMYGTIRRLRQALKEQYPKAERAFVTHRQMGVVFNSCLLLTK